MEQCYLHLWWYLFDFSPLCIFKCVLKSPAWTDAKSHRLHLFDFFSTVHLQMCPQTVCHRGRKITLVAFVWLFSTVHFQMCPQTVCPRGRIITLVAFVGLFSTVLFQVCPQCTWNRAGIVTLVAFVWLFSTVRFQMCPQMTCMRRGKVAFVAYGSDSPGREFWPKCGPFF